MDMWTTQERCPHAHSLNKKYESQTKIESAKDYPQILRRRLFKIVLIPTLHPDDLDDDCPFVGRRFLSVRLVQRSSQSFSVLARRGALHP